MEVPPLRVPASVGLNASLESPSLFLESIDLAEDAVRFCQMSREAYKESSFLDHRKKKAGIVEYNWRLSHLIQSTHQRVVPDLRGNLIFHTSHCCSTLLARCFEILDVALVLKEPSVLRQLSLAKRKWHERQGLDYSTMKDVIIYFLTRTYVSPQIALIKCTSVCSNLFGDLLDGFPGLRPLFLYSSLEQFLVGMYKEGEIRAKIYEATYLPLFLIDAADYPELRRVYDNGLTTAMKMAFMWLVRIYFYLKFAESRTRTRFYTLDCDVFLRTPYNVLTSLAKYFRYDLSREDDLIDRLLPVLAAYSKDPGRPYHAESRLQERISVLKIHAAELHEAADWCQEVCHRLDIPEKLPSALPMNDQAI